MSNLLFTDYKLGNTTLKNRIVMAPMTRSRAIDFEANDMMREYYEARSEAGLIISEGIAPSMNAHGYPRVPGIYLEKQKETWKPITEAVKQKNGHIFAQLWHVGRVAHPLNQPAGAHVEAPSAIKLDQKLYTDQKGKQYIPEPKKMSIEDIENAKSSFVSAAKNAIEAGFDGIEIHSAHGYLFEQFLNPHVNKRTDQYGGNIENRIRFLVETVESVSDAIGAEKVGIRWSPYSQFSGMLLYDEIHETYIRLARLFNKWNIAYIHLNSMDEDAARRMVYTRIDIRNVFDGALILCGNYKLASAQKAIAKKEADLIAFGRPFIANPDLVYRFKNGIDLHESNPKTYYTPGREGYVDFDYEIYQES